MNIDRLLTDARSKRASDVHLTYGRSPIYRVDGALAETGYDLTPEERDSMILSMLNGEQRVKLERGEDVDICYRPRGGVRHRVNVFRQQGRLACAIRIINDKIPSFDLLGLPPVLRDLAGEPRGLILVTGPTGSGKSTTLAAMVDYINETRACHILTIEDPVEYIYTQKKAVINQRDVGADVGSFSSALRSAMREDPDVILVGEMRDRETIAAALTAAETGHLVLSTLHTTGAAATIDRIIDVFEPGSQHQVRTQLSGVLKGVITQCLLPRAGGGGRVAAFEVMIGTDAVLNLIRESKCHQINSTIETGMRQGMVLLDTSLASLVRGGVVTLEAALKCANNKNELAFAAGRI